jgi:hypothetical protein
VALVVEGLPAERRPPLREGRGREELVLAGLPVACVAAVLLLAERMSTAFRLDIDPNYYHLSIVNAFVSGTSFGDSIYPHVNFSFRPDAYPLSGHGMGAELVVAAGGLSGLLILGVASVVLLMLAAVSIAMHATPAAAESAGGRMRRLIVVGLLSALFVGLPMVVYLAAGMPSDVLACAALVALVAAALREEPQLALAAGLAGTSLGAKTTTLVPVLIVVAYVVVRHRRALNRGPALLAAALFLLAGGHWFIRDLIAHGSPFWPQLAAPWGDPTPIFFSDSARFIEHPLHTLRAASGHQLATFGPGVPLTIAAAVVGATIAPRRWRYVIWGCLGAALLAWACSQQTGIEPGNDDSRIAFGAASRYFGPVQILAAAMTCHLIRLGSRPALALGCIGGALNLVGIATLVSFRLWGLAVVLALAVLCCCAVFVARDARPSRRLRAASAVAVAALAVPGVALARSPQRLWTQAIENSFTPYVKQRRACLIDLTCIARDGDRLSALDSPGFRLGPYLDTDVSVVPGRR